MSNGSVPGACVKGLSARQAGFTLIETMVVIGIMGIIMAIALPAFSAWRESSALQTATETLMSHIKQARINAVSNNRSVSITFTSSGYTIDSGAANPRKYALDVYSKKLSLGFITFTSNKLTFSSDGTATAGSLILKNSDGGQHKIDVNAVGRVYHD